MSLLLDAPGALAQTASRTHPDCPLCRNGSAELFAKHQIPIFGCSSCGHRFAVPSGTVDHIATVYSDDYFNGGGAGYDDYLSEGPLLRQHGRRYGRILKRFGHTGTLLDVGCAAGFVLQGLLDEGWSGRGVEPNASMGRFGRETLGLDITTSPLEAFHATEQFDVVSLVQVVAHFVDPRGVIEQVAGLVKPGGYCLAETWNVQSWSARLFSTGWHEYSPPSVLQWFSPGTLDHLFGQCGFSRAATGRPQKWLNAGHAKSLLRHKVGGSLAGKLVCSALRAIPDRVNLPYPSEDLFWTLYQRK